MSTKPTTDEAGKETMPPVQELDKKTATTAESGYTADSIKVLGGMEARAQASRHVHRLHR